jgi:hypothetical protein
VTDVLVKGDAVPAFPGCIVEDGTRGPWIQFPWETLEEMGWPGDRVPVVASLASPPASVTHLTFGSPGSVRYQDFKLTSLVERDTVPGTHVVIPGPEVSWLEKRPQSGDVTVRVRAGYRQAGGPPASWVRLSHPAAGAATWLDEGRIMEGTGTRDWPEKILGVLRTAAWVSHTARDVMVARRAAVVEAERLEAEAAAQALRDRLVRLL